MAQHYESILTIVKIKQLSTNIWPMVCYKLEGKFLCNRKIKKITF